MISDKWNRDLPAIEKRKEEQRRQWLEDYATQILEAHEERMVEHRKVVAAAYAKAAAEIAALRANRKVRG